MGLHHANKISEIRNSKSNILVYWLKGYGNFSGSSFYALRKFTHSSPQDGGMWLSISEKEGSS